MPCSQLHEHGDLLSWKILRGLPEPARGCRGVDAPESRASRGLREKAGRLVPESIEV